MFVVKARSLPKSGAPERHFNFVGSGLTRKHFTRLERLARNKHPSLLWKVVTYGRKKFYKNGTWWTLPKEGRRRALVELVAAERRREEARVRTLEIRPVGGNLQKIKNFGAKLKKLKIWQQISKNQTFGAKFNILNFFLPN
jgi:hypothetical protein